MSVRAHVVAKVARYQARDVLRSRWLLAYVGFFAVVGDALLRFGGDGGKALLSLVNVVLFVVPLVALVFGTTYLYGAREFTVVLLAQPVARARLFGGLLLGLAVPLSLGFAAGVLAPFLLHGVAPGEGGTLATLVACGVALTFVFVGLAFVVATRSDDRVRGLGTAVGLWLLLGIVYDGAVLVAVAALSDYPVERPLLGAMLANPIDLARVLLLLRFDTAALLGYTGAVFEQFFGGRAGTLVAAAALLAWVAVPLGIGLRAFRRKDF